MGESVVNADRTGLTPRIFVVLRGSDADGGARMAIGARAIMAAALTFGAGAAFAALPPGERDAAAPALARADDLAVRPMDFALRGVSQAASAGPAPVVRAGPVPPAALSGAETAVLAFGVASTAAGAAMLGAAAARVRRTRP
jgi:hypothetical protein